MTNIVINTPDGQINAALATPRGYGPWPGVVVVHDAISASSGGMPDIVRRITDAGFIALAPDLYSRGGTVRCIKRVFTELKALRGRAYDDLEAARQTLLAHSDCTGLVGIAGFCMGGGFALVLAARGFDAAAPFYPSFPASRYDEVLDGACPIVASFGRRDPALPGAGEKLESALTSRGIEHDVKTYDKAGHSFANPYPLAPLLRVVGFGYDQRASEDAWHRVFDFLHAHLDTSGTKS